MLLIAPAASVLRRIVFVQAQRKDAHNAQSGTELKDLIPLNDPEVEEEEVGKPKPLLCSACARRSAGRVCRACGAHRCVH